MDLLKGYRQRRRERLYRLYERHKRIRALLKEHAEDILESKNFKGTRAHIQHGSMTVHNHCMDVARYSLLLNNKLGIGCNKHDLIRGALLHDYFLYDWHDKAYLAHRQRLHGFHHPMTALKNAEKEYTLNDTQREIIKKHMWPLSVIPPMCREAWVVTAADKYCSFLETVGLHKGHGAYHVADDSLQDKLAETKKLREVNGVFGADTEANRKGGAQAS